MENNKNRQIDFLLADFNSAKNEISRRSTLQKTVLTLLIAFYAWITNELLKDFSNVNRVPIIWLVVPLAYIFYYREGKEISRLGFIIRERIAEYVSEIIDIEKEKIIPTEVMDRERYPTDRITKRYDKIFNYTIFLILPAIFTVLFICNIIKCI